MYSITAIAGSATYCHTVQIPHSNRTEDSIPLILQAGQDIYVDVDVILRNRPA